MASTGERRFEHYDSCAQSNRAKAEAVAKCLAPLLRESGVRGCGFAGMEDTPQQANGHDCGLYTIAIAEALCEGLASDKLPAAVGASPARVAALTPTRWILRVRHSSSSLPRARRSRAAGSGNIFQLSSPT